MINLKDSTDLDDKLYEIFGHKRVTTVGFSIKSDLEMFSKHFPHFRFYQNFRELIDAQEYY